VTNEEIELLRSLCQVEVLTFAPEGTTPAALQRFEQIVTRLRRMERSGWVQLVVVAQMPLHFRKLDGVRLAAWDQRLHGQRSVDTGLYTTGRSYE
jgi:hypothetical protein